MLIRRRFPDELILAGLDNPLLGQAGNVYWVASDFENGDIRHRSRGLMPMAYPTINQQAFAHQVVRALNKRADMGGHWLVCWCDPVIEQTPLGPLTRLTRFLCLWKDKDGDVVATQDSEDSLAQLVRDGADRWVSGAFETVRRYIDHLRELEIREGADTIKRAQGEKSRILN